jgi:hypothetical protein
VLAGIFGVIALGLVGLAVFAALVGILLIVQLWVESARLTRDLGLAKKECDDAHDALELKDVERREAEKRADRLPELQGENARLEAQVQDLRLELQTSLGSSEELLDAINVQIVAIDLVGKHRLMAAEGPPEWPVVRARLEDENSVLLIAYVGDQAERLAGEWVTVLDSDRDELGSGRIITAGDRQAVVGFDISEVPDWFGQELQARRNFAPEGYALRLAGLGIYSDLSDEDLDELRKAALTLSETLVRVLQPNQLTSDAENPQLAGGET